MDCSRPGSSVHGILQVRILEWVAIFYSRVSSQPRDQTRISCIGKWCLFLFFLFDTTEPPGKHFYLAGLGKGLRRCMSNKILGNTDTVSLEFSPWELLIERKRQSQEGNIEPEKSGWQHLVILIWFWARQPLFQAYSRQSPAVSKILILRKAI